MSKRIEQLSLFEEGSGPGSEAEQGAGDADTLISVEVRRVIDIMRECERSLSFFAVDCGLSPGEREALRRAASALERQVNHLSLK